MSQGMRAGVRQDKQARLLCHLPTGQDWHLQPQLAGLTGAEHDAGTMLIMASPASAARCSGPALPCLWRLASAPRASSASTTGSCPAKLASARGVSPAGVKAVGGQSATGWAAAAVPKSAANAKGVEAKLYAGELPPQLLRVHAREGAEGTRAPPNAPSSFWTFTSQPSLSMMCSHSCAWLCCRRTSSQTSSTKGLPGQLGPKCWVRNQDPETGQDR